MTPSFQLLPYRPVTPPPFILETIHHNLWRTSKQSYSMQRWNRAMGLFFYNWTPEMQPCSDPLCCTPYQQPHLYQTTPPSLCSLTTLHPLSMLSIGLPGIWVTLCREKDLRAFKSLVFAQYPCTAQLVL